MNEKWALLNRGPSLHISMPSPAFTARERRCLLVALFFVSTCLMMISFHQRMPHSSSLSATTSTTTLPKETLTDFKTCSITAFLSTGFPFLSTASPLPTNEFITRRHNLALALLADGIDAFIVEPGYTFQYYANVSQPDWEVWEPEERPFLMAVRPVVIEAKGDGEREVVRSVKVKTTFLAPSFEVERARLLGMPFARGDGEVAMGDEDEEWDFVPWEEHWNPYTTLLDSWDQTGIMDSTTTAINDQNKAKPPKIMVDDEMRDFIQRGLSENGFDVVRLGGEVERVKQTKTQREIEILRAVNTGTVEALRAMRGCMVEGLSEDEVMDVLDATLRAGGLEPFFDIVLFDENASNPHGGTDGTKVLTPETFVLIDVGAHLHGYSSDICRTFFPPFFPIPTHPSTSITHKLAIFDLVLAAQSASMEALKPNNTAASIDIAARNVIAAAGYGDAFTHRVGHGIGIKAHESPYLNKGNTGTRLREGMVFTSEPGVYLVDEFGVRSEDVLLVRGEGEEPECLSGQRAAGAWDP